MNFYNAVILSVIFICCASLTTALTAEDYKSEDVISFEFSITLCEDHRDNVEHPSQDMNAMEELPRILFDFFNLTNWFRKLEPDKFDINKGIPVVGDAENQDTRSLSDGCRKYMYRVHYLCCLTKLKDPSEEILFTVEMITNSCEIGKYGDSYGSYRMDCEHMKQQKENNPRNIKQKVYTEVAKHKRSCQHNCECTCSASWTNWLKNAGPWALGGATAGATALFWGVPAALGLLGFTAKGISYGSFAAWIMSISRGGGLVATLQAIGAAGVGWKSAMMGAVLGGAVGSAYSCRC